MLPEQALSIESQRLDLIAAARANAERLTYNHHFNNKEARCPCGMRRYEYDAATPTERWDNREHFDCKRSKP